LGSGISSSEIYIKALNELWEKILKYRAFAEIDIGGGFSYPYRREDKEFDFNNLKKNLEAFASNYEKVHGFSPRIILEPGRWIVAGGGVLLAKVTDIKTKSGQTFVTLNTGMQHLIRPALYRSYHEVLFLQKDTDYVKAFVAGNSCENADVMPLERTVPSSLKRGDLALILDVGAYGYVMSSNYNSYPRPREIIIRENGRIEETTSFDKYLLEILKK
jgi:diaminopimelate decarboxylase